MHFPTDGFMAGVPYVLGDCRGSGKRIIGEVYEIDDETMLGLDQYEGISKGYYARIPLVVDVRPADELVIAGTAPTVRRMAAHMYVLNESSEVMRAQPHLNEYTLEIHKRVYQPIAHILVKQNMYLASDGEVSPTFQDEKEWHGSSSLIGF